MLAIDPNSVEILAPAGDFAALQAAIDAGADAAYFGLAQLNMRARARRSFDLPELPEIMQRLHQAGIKGYLTLNTILYDHDLPLTRRMLESALSEGVDAVIVSDMAAIQMARSMGIEVHISTQQSISNFEAAKFFAQFSDRIVLARELTLPMIKKMHERIQSEDLRGPAGRPLEIEAFAHGALCVAVSGRCGMSLHTHNASANRGACIQNCRREYKVVDVETNEALKIDNNLVMSPSDICTIDFLDEMVDAGVRVLKLEGRARAPEYVSTVTRAYRKAVNAMTTGTYDDQIKAELYQDLKGVYNRGLSSGYYLGRDQKWSGARGSKATQQKIYVGEVTHYFSKLGVAEIKACAGKIGRGDGYVIIGRTTGSLEGTIAEMHDDDGVITAAEHNAIFSIKVDRKVRLKDKLYRMEPVPA